MNRIDYGEEGDYFDLCSPWGVFFLRNDDDAEADRLRQIVYLARYARVVPHPNALDDMPIAQLRAWVKAVSDMVSSENASTSINER